MVNYQQPSSSLSSERGLSMLWAINEDASLRRGNHIAKRTYLCISKTTSRVSRIRLVSNPRKEGWLLKRDQELKKTTKMMNSISTSEYYGHE